MELSKSVPGTYSLHFKSFKAQDVSVVMPIWPSCVGQWQKGKERNRRAAVGRTVGRSVGGGIEK